MHSTTEYIGGHGTSIGGIIVDGGNLIGRSTPTAFPCSISRTRAITARLWTQAVKDRSDLSPTSLKPVSRLLRDIGAAMSPFNAFMFIQGLETVALRMRQHSQQRNGSGLNTSPNTPR